MKGAHPLPFEEFLRRARALHGNRYDYSLAQEGWRNTHGKVVLICPEHGRFEQVAGNHLQGTDVQGVVSFALATRLQYAGHPSNLETP